MSFLTYQSQIGMAFSIAGLALVAPSTYFFRMYSRTLDLAQMIYVFALIYAANQTLFADNLSYSWLTFMPSFLNFCTAGDYSCTYGDLLSPAIVWAGAALLFMIIIKIVAACKKNSWSYLKFYKFFRGFSRWTMAPLVYYSTDILISKLQAESYDDDFIASAVVLGFYALLSFVEIISFKCGQSENKNSWSKWIQFFSYWSLASIMVLVSISVKIDQMAKYFIYAPLIIFFVAYMIKYNFTFKVFERVAFCLQQAIIITLYSIFIFKSDYISTYNLDFFGIAIILFLEIILFLAKLYAYCKQNGDDKEGSVNPQQYEDRKVQPEKRKNNFGDSNIQMSYEQLNASNSSPRRGGNQDRDRRKR